MDLHTHDHDVLRRKYRRGFVIRLIWPGASLKIFFHQLTQSIIILTMVLIASSSYSIIIISVNNENVYRILNN